MRARLADVGGGGEDGGATGQGNEQTGRDQRDPATRPAGRLVPFTVSAHDLSSWGASVIAG
jgi:hypothetical protein